MKDIVYKCAVSTNVYYNKVYLDTAEGSLKKWFYNKMTTNDIIIAKYISEIKTKHTAKCILSYSNISNFELLNYINPNKILDKRSELFSKCHHFN